MLGVGVWVGAAAKDTPTVTAVEGSTDLYLNDFIFAHVNMIARFTKRRDHAAFWSF